jgi:tRNA threonylcarbamoyladenosine biosynthesis protein TsaE
MSEVVARTDRLEATQAVGEALAGLVQPGDLVLLSGEMGAGKTALTQGLGRGLGVTDRITSPTFTIAHEYAGRCTVHHLDVYRLEHLNEALDVGIERDPRRRLGRRHRMG